MCLENIVWDLSHATDIIYIQILALKCYSTAAAPKTTAAIPYLTFLLFALPPLDGAVLALDVAVALPLAEAELLWDEEVLLLIDDEWDPEEAELELAPLVVETDAEEAFTLEGMLLVVVVAEEVLLAVAVVLALPEASDEALWTVFFDSTTNCGV